MFIEKYGDPSILACLFLEFLGLPVPGETLMAYLGYLTWKSGGRSVMLPIFYAAIGTILGALFAYGIGYRYGEGILLKYGRYVLSNRAFLTTWNIYAIIHKKCE